MSRRATRHRRERGSASLELLGVLPLLLVTGLLALQVGAFLWAVTGTDEAVRQGARALSLGRDGCAAAEGTLPDALDLVACRASGGGAEPASLAIEVDVPVLPVVAPFVPDVVVERTARLP